MKRSDIRAGDLLRATVLMALLALPARALDDLKPRDLTPVTWLTAPVHAPVELARNGTARAVIFVADPKPSATLTRLVDELLEVVRLSTGATFERVFEPPAVDQPAIVIGDCEETRQAGIDAATLPFEGFVVKTAPNRVYLVGSTQALPTGSNRWAYWASEGTAWAVADFLERFVGVRWYWPTDLGGRTLVTHASLVIPPVAYQDQPVFRQRLFHPKAGWPLPQNARWFDKEPLPFAPGAIPDDVAKVDMADYLPLVREGNSWPYQVKVHEPQKLWKQWESKWSKHPELHDMFQQKADGTPHLSMLCYSSTNTLAYLLQGCEDAWDRGSGWTYGPVQYPHLVCEFYRTNRTVLAGTFINGGIMADWTTSAPTLYVWMKALWNPELDVDAVLDAMCRRLYGQAGGTVRELIRLQCARWDTVKGGLADQGRIPPAMYQKIWPPDVVVQMMALRDKARVELADDPVGRQRFLYWTWTFDGFLAEAKGSETNQPADGEWTPAGQ